MAYKCAICGKRRQTGHNVSYSKRRTPRVFLPNLKKVKLVNNKRVKVCMDCLSKLKKEGKLFQRSASFARKEAPAFKLKQADGLPVKEKSAENP